MVRMPQPPPKRSRRYASEALSPDPGDMQSQRQLIAKARAARRSAYAPYSKFRVGAALLSASGKLFTGCNVENASYGLTICAERNAVFAAVAAGERRFKVIAIAARVSGTLRPCGACLQVLAE